MKRALERQAAGFTLIEMLVVLAVIGALATVALRSIDGLANRARFESTQRALADARDAILGVAHDDGFEAGLLGDLARLPDPTTEPLRPLLDLWQIPTGVAANHLAVAPGDGSIALPAGWRGPYLQLPPGATNALDGWGNPLLVDTSGGAFVLRSLGADGLAGGASFDSDLSVVLVDPAQSIDLTRSEVTGTVTVESDPGLPNWSIAVYAYEPDAATGQLLARREDDATPELTPTSLPATFAFAFSGANALTPGPRVVRAYFFDNSTLPADPRTTAVPARSPLRRITLQSGATQLDFSID